MVSPSVALAFPLPLELPSATIGLIRVCSIQVHSTGYGIDLVALVTGWAHGR